MTDDTLQQLRQGQLQGARSLSLRCDLREFPSEIYQLADSLEILDLSGNALSQLPDDLSRLHQLRIIFCSNNQFTHLPEVLGTCPQLRMIGFKANRIRQVAPESLPQQHLRWLILTDNAISQLPEHLGECRQMQKLMLAGNQLSALPESLAQCDKLELLRISANQLTSLPAWLFDLPKLSWLAYAGNPFSDALEGDLLSSVQQIAWSKLQIQQELGQGASGVIYQALWQKSADVALPVAVKMFKAQLTSDGLPRCEMYATLRAGQHPHLFGLEGVISQHPQGAMGLVMPLLAPQMKVLAAPPSFDSCSRDVYAEQQRFTLASVLKIATGIASAMQHLHARGISHGDLYAHNILHDSTGFSVLSDFGGAACLPPELSASLQKLETRAFGCLLEELLQRCDYLPSQENRMQSLWQLQKICFATQVQQRPVFSQIQQELAKISLL
jgi:Protein tyrosine and serine/threonine kinase/Leucine rich repeat